MGKIVYVLASLICCLQLVIQKALIPSIRRAQLVAPWPMKLRWQMSKKNTSAKQRVDIIRKLLVAMNNANATPGLMAPKVFG